MSAKICYCYNFSVANIVEDVRSNAGRSQILEMIIAKKQAGACACATLHPQGR